MEAGRGWGLGYEAPSSEVCLPLKYIEKDLWARAVVLHHNHLQ